MSFVPGWSPQNAKRDADIWRTNFAEYATGAAPSDWSDLWNTAGTRIIEADGSAPSGKRLRINAGGSIARTGFVWDRPPNLDDVDIVTLCAIATDDATGITNFVGPICRAGGAVGSEDNYQARFGNEAGGSHDQRNLGKYVSGTGTTLNGAVLSWTVGQKYYIRFRAWGTSLSMKMWEFGTAEPGPFDYTDTDSDLTDGATGVWAAIDNVDIHYFYFAVARNQRPAPLL